MNAFRNNISENKPRRSSARDRAFSMVELLVVIAIISVLAGLLLVALGGARARAEVTKTRATMQSFASACDTFQLEHSQYPGIIPETILAANPAISGTENALLHFMGGYSVLSPQDGPSSAAALEYDNFGDCGANILCYTFGTSGWKLKVDTQRIGEGPLINGTLYSPYFTPKGDELQVANGQVGTPQFGGMGGGGIPDLIDAWGQPIVFVKRSRPIGPLAFENGSGPPQFLYGTMVPYIESKGLGEFGKDQMDGGKGSIFNNAAGSPPADRYATFAQILRHAAFGEPDDPLRGNSQGAYMLFSAGPDGIYFSIADGPGTPKDTVNNIVDHEFFGNPQVVKEYDDIRIFGGG
ncbi:MAG: type II secretion system protein [Planctomycetes bacterium]|nr:type II secretion system protein [Planctomycetota bacterium]